MTISDYYKLLGLSHGSSIEEIKKAYRRKAREYHPDINHSPDAKDQFICVTEAYEFLLTNHEKMMTDDQAYKQAMDDWRKYRQDRSRKRARVYAQASYSRFKNTNLYKTTRIFDGTTIILCLMVSIMVLIVAISGYIYRLNHPIHDVEMPSIVAFILFLLLGMVLFVVSLVFLKAYVQTSKKHRKM
jgi:uncharacterized integral membrane protein